MFDIINSHDWLTYPAGIHAKQVSGKPLVIHVHATDFDRSRGNVNPTVYAIEKNPEAVLLLEKNRRKFRTDGIRIIEGSAPEALVHLEPPTHLFIGGSSGNLKEILTVVKQKNPNVKIVISAISLETVRDVMDAEKEGLLTDMEVTQICASRSRVLGQYHMMTGMNPVYIISAGGKEDGFGNFDHGDLQRKRENSGGVRTYGGISGSK